MKSSYHVKTGLWTIYRSEVEQEEKICPYCMSEPSRGQFGCCGETSAHWENAFGIIGNSGWILESEVSEIIDDIESQQAEIKVKNV